MRFLGTYRRFAFWRRPVAAVALSAYLITTIGLPLPTFVNKLQGVPFPCQHHACGCSTAEQCWDRCCCYSASEKLAWARKHQVEPPRKLLLAIASEAHEHEHLAALASKNKPRGCCAHRKVQTASVAPGHCDPQHSDPVVRSPAADAGQGRITWVLGIAALKCHGGSEYWSLSGAVMPAPQAIVWQFQWNVVEWFVLSEPSLYSHELVPPVPPPRI